MTDALFTLDLEIENTNHSWSYGSVKECLDDSPLEQLFQDNLVTGCVIRMGDKRIAGLPFLTWDNLKERLIANSETILRGTE